MHELVMGMRSMRRLRRNGLSQQMDSSQDACGSHTTAPVLAKGAV